MKQTDDKLIELIDVTKSYPMETGQPYQAIRGISLTIGKGQFVSIMGPSGSGKSTLMHILGALDNPTTGTYLFKGKNITSYTPDELARIRNKEIGFVFQSFNLLPRTSVFKNVERPMIYAGIKKEERYKQVMNALQLVGIAQKAQNLSNKISGGEIQRVAIARALIMNPAIILADEPTGNLDSHTSHEIMTLLHDLHEKGSTVAVITHDPTVASFAHRKIHIVDGKIVSDEGSGK
ncbi:MAG TPA: ABC transporter ATP-binding protein [Patescibacteria group bacterium]|nr:ABC transporter ATP-binding protein [Patescibacteria group bacterium]